MWAVTMKTQSLRYGNFLVRFYLISLCLTINPVAKASSSPLRKKNLNRYDLALEQLDPLAREDFLEFNKLSNAVFDDFEQSLKERKINRLLSNFRKFFMSFSKEDENEVLDKDRIKNLNGKLIPQIGADTCAHRAAFLVNIAELWGVDAIGQIAVDRKRLLPDGSFAVEPGHVAAVFRFNGQGWIVDPVQGFLDDVNIWEVPELGVKKTFRFLPFGQATIWETEGLYEQCSELSRKEVNHFLKHDTDQLAPLPYNEYLVRKTALSMVVFKEIMVHIVSESVLTGQVLSDAFVDDHHYYRKWSQRFVDNGEPSDEYMNSVEARYSEHLLSDLFISFSGGWTSMGKQPIYERYRQKRSSKPVNMGSYLDKRFE